jgi:hypothetical protein
MAFGPAPVGPAPVGPAPVGQGAVGPASFGPAFSGPDPFVSTAVEAERSGTGPKVQWTLVAAIVAAVVVVGLAASVIYGGPGDGAGGTASARSGASSPPKDAAHEQAVAIDKVLDESKPSRGKLQQGLSQMLRCSKTDQAVAAIQRVADQRAEQLQQAKELKVDTLDGGDDLKQHLVDALAASQRADEAYLKWAKNYQAHDCSGPTTGDAAYNAGNSASAKATKAKSAFIDLWGPIAEQEGLPARSGAEI